MDCLIGEGNCQSAPGFPFRDFRVEDPSVVLNLCLKAGSTRFQ